MSYSQHDIEPAKLLQRLGNQVLDVLLLSHISNDGNGLGRSSLEFADKLDGALSTSGVDVGADDVRSLGSEGESRFESEAVSSTRDNGDSVRKAKGSDLGEVT